MLNCNPTSALVAQEVEAHPGEPVLPPSWPYPVPESAQAEIRIWLLPDGRCDVSATCNQVRDCWYMPRPDADWPLKIAELIAELRGQLASDQSKSTE